MDGGTGRHPCPILHRRLNKVSSIDITIWRCLYLSYHYTVIQMTPQEFRLSSRAQAIKASEIRELLKLVGGGVAVPTSTPTPQAPKATW